MDAARVCDVDSAPAAVHDRDLSLDPHLQRNGTDPGFPGRRLGGAEWYRRATRAHANCIENLPVFGAIVFALYVGNVGGALVDALSVAVLAARIVQSTVHVCFVHTNTIASVRFGFFFVQFICFMWLTGIIVVKVSGS